MNTTHLPTASTNNDRPTRRMPLRSRPFLVGLAAILLTVVSVTSEANPVLDSTRIPLPINGTMNEKGIPIGWDLEVFHDHPQIKLESFKDGQFGIRLVSEDSSFGLHKTVEVDLKEFPILSWRWKVDRLPLTGDIREKDKNDQAAQLYVVFPNSLIKLRSPMIGYLWDSNAPAGTIADGHSPITPIKIIVLRSGKQQLGKWIQERRNVAEDYVRLFGKDSLPKVGRVAIWINTQHTKSTAQASFADLQFQRAN